ncbi:MAG TPA: serine protease [Amaricoccus sp.]|uniref:S1C family serine protease n=1 Tax=Amaricoccus sp. TaxID=1872485 RepID=UPI002BB5A011|nr:serine protease [Amaricoccus sp.]HMQ95017.1 serine protease [Amaricoccus sp.]HMR52549.1 serine protease [Amaricoccus sp.]HMR59292.1 serine protease [Amaricoccus sp.]HMT99581.1 serine protease [Amaricoccus sp.]
MRKIHPLFAAAACALAAVGAAPAGAGEALYAGFDPAALSGSDLRFLEAALAAAGDLSAAPDEVWDRVSDGALAGYAAREFEDRPRNLHAAALAIALLARIEDQDWRLGFDADLGLSMALPEALLDAPEAEDGGTRRWSTQGSLTVLTHRFSDEGALDWHAAAETTNAAPAALETYRDADTLITRGKLEDGRAFHTRSDRIQGQWSTVFLAAGPESLAELDLIAASIAPGAAKDWHLSRDGALAGLLTETLALLEAMDRGLPGLMPASAQLLPGAISLPEAGPAAQGTGTGFYVGARILVTADHVVGQCDRVALADGTELLPLGADAELDVAAFASPVPAPAWLALAPEAKARLGQRVLAAGFPYYSIVGTSLNLTGGNVSALAGVNDDARFFSFTAPVQPGNSGGPLIDAAGQVTGLVVSRLSEQFIVEETGSLPQNVNYALNVSELKGFLSSIGVAHSQGGLAGFDPDSGAPKGFDRAVVPVLCL